MCLIPEIYEHLKLIKTSFPNQIVKIWLIGSRALGEARDDSDWDFLVEGDEKVLMKIKSQHEKFKKDSVHIFIIYNGDDFKDPFSDECGSLNEWKWEKYNNQYCYLPGLKRIGQLFEGKHPAKEINIKD